MLLRGTCIPVAVLASAVATWLAIASAVQWQAPAGCPDRIAVEQRIDALLGRTPTEHELRAVGVVQAGPPWRLELETTLGGSRQHRVIEAEDCGTLAEAAALVLAVSVDPLGVSGAPAMLSEGERAEIVPEAPLVAPVEPSPSLESREPPGLPTPRSPAFSRLSLRLGAGAERGAVPGGTGGVRLGLALEGDRGVLVLDGSYWIDRLAVLRAGPPPSGARVGLGTVAVQGGVRLGGPRVGVPLSIGLEAGGLRTRAVGLAGGQDLTLAWLAGVIGAGVHATISGRVALWTVVEGVLPVVRPRLRVGRSGDDVVLHEPAIVGVRALAGISIRIAERP